MPTLYLVGAGCSLGTLASVKNICPPIARDFVNELEKRGWISEYPELTKVVAHARRAHSRVGLEELWTCIDLHAKFPGAFPISWKPRGQVIRDLKSALVRRYGRCCDEISESISKKDHCTVVAIAKKIKAKDTLVSFNYDTIIERVISRISRKPLEHGKDKKKGIIRFAKPHGSASWPLANLPHAVTDGKPLLASLCHEAVQRGDADPLLLGAVPLKSELIFEVQEYYHSQRVFEVIREQWRTVANAVATATRIVVLGCSFPREDTYGRFFFNEGKAMREQRLSLKIDVFNRRKTDGSVREIFPTVSPPDFKGRVTPASFSGS